MSHAANPSCAPPATCPATRAGGARRVVSLLLALCLVLEGCSALVPKLEPPKFKVVNLKMLGGDRQHQQLRLRLQVTNPNDRQIAVRSIDYQVALAGTDFAQGSSAEAFTLPALGQTEFDLDMNADLGALLRVVGAHLGASALEYEVNGHVHLAEGLIREFPFKGHGQLALH
jgi:LEA14-like dessication related protein